LALGQSEIFNTDQGSQFTSLAFTSRLEAAGIRISMDGRGRALDNVFVERLWRSVKYEDIYPNGYATLVDARQGLTRYFAFYNEERPHQALKYRTPAEVYADVVHLNPDILVHERQEATLISSKNCLDKGVHFRMWYRRADVRGGDVFLHRQSG